jgi:hypothetical protein
MQPFARAWITAFGATVVLFLLTGSGAGADVGAGIGADPILLPQPALPGHGYSMPPVYVVNTGTEPSRYGLVLQRLRQGDDTTVPTQWVTFGKNDFTLGPKESTTVDVTLNVPPDARTGGYASNVVVATIPPGAVAGGTALGARAATDLKFQVSKAPPLIPWPWPWWTYLTLGAAILLAGGEAVRRRLGIRIQLERRT